MLAPKTIRRIILYLWASLFALLPLTHVWGLLVTEVWSAPQLLLAWKEVVIAALIVLQTTLSIRRAPRWPWLVLIVALLLVIISTWKAGIPLKFIVLGARVELLWLVLLVSTQQFISANSKFLRRAAPVFRRLIVRSALIGIVGVSFVSAGSLLLGPVEFFSTFGITGGWEASSELVIQSPLCHSVDTVGNSCRLAGGMATPNNFAGYLLLVLPLVLIEGYSSRYKSKKYAWYTLAVLLGIFLYLTYARFAYLAVLCILLLAGLKILYRKVTIPKFNTLFTIAALLPALALGGFLLVGYEQFLELPIPSSITKPGSTIDHYKKTKAGAEIAAATPGIVYSGYGLAQSGPIAKPQYGDPQETIIVQNNLDIASKYEILPWELPVPENWFIQLVLNGGLLYALLYSVLALYPLRYLYTKNTTQFIIALGLYGIVIGNLFLHIWENPVVSSLYSGMLIYLAVTNAANIDKPKK